MAEFDGAWKLPLTELTLPHDEVHVWRASLDQHPSFVEQLGQTLSAAERTRAERFYFTHDRQRFIICRGFLRSILGRYMGIEPEQAQFCSGPYGKLALAETRPTVKVTHTPAAPWDDNTLRFNVSHSQALALYAFTRGREIGVDLEYIRPVEGDEQFLLYWTRKEAYLKACGDGLTGLESMRTQSYNSLIPTGWFIQHLTPTPGYVAALAVQDQVTIRIAPPRLVYWQWVLPEK